MLFFLDIDIIDHLHHRCFDHTFVDGTVPGVVSGEFPLRTSLGGARDPWRRGFLVVPGGSCWLNFHIRTATFAGARFRYEFNDVTLYVYQICEKERLITRKQRWDIVKQHLWTTSTATGNNRHHIFPPPKLSFSLRRQPLSGKQFRWNLRLGWRVPWMVRLQVELNMDWEPWRSSTSSQLGGF